MHQAIERGPSLQVQSGLERRHVGYEQGPNHLKD